MLSGDGSGTLTEDDHRLANELAAELAQQNKSLVDGGHHDTHLMTSYLYSTDFDLNTNSKHSSQTNHINNTQVTIIYFVYIYIFRYIYPCIIFIYLSI